MMRSASKNSISFNDVISTAQTKRKMRFMENVEKKFCVGIWLYWYPDYCK
jgi:hypothetical protein